MVSSVSGSGNSLQTYWAQQVSRAQMQKQMFSKLDTNGDGSLSSDELAKMVANGPSGGPSAAVLLKQMDTNGDGSISESEFESFTPPPPPQMGGTSNTSSADFVQQLLKQLDTNGDGSISESEFGSILNQDTNSTSATDAASSTDNTATSNTDLVKELFNKIDANSDGSVSSDELSKYVANNPPAPPPPPPGGFNAMGQTSQADSTQSTSDTTSNVLEKFLEALKEDGQTTTSSTKGTDGSQTSMIASMFNSILQSYMQLSSNGLSQTSTESLLGSSVYA